MTFAYIAIDITYMLELYDMVSIYSDDFEIMPAGKLYDYMAKREDWCDPTLSVMTIPILATNTGVYFCMN